MNIATVLCVSRHADLERHARIGNVRRRAVAMPWVPTFAHRTVKDAPPRLIVGVEA